MLLLLLSCATEVDGRPFQRKRLSEYPTTLGRHGVLVSFSVSHLTGRLVYSDDPYDNYCDDAVRVLCECNVAKRGEIPLTFAELLGATVTSEDGAIETILISFKPANAVA